MNDFEVIENTVFNELNFGISVNPTKQMTDESLWAKSNFFFIIHLILANSEANDKSTFGIVCVKLQSFVLADTITSL